MVIVDTDADVFSLVALVKFENSDKDNISNLRSALHTKLTTERIPKYIREVDEFPRTVNNKMKRKFFPNLKKVTFKSNILKRNIKLSVSNAALRTVDYKGGLDLYLKRVKSYKLSSRVKKLKNQIIAKV